MIDACWLKLQTWIVRTVCRRDVRWAATPMFLGSSATLVPISFSFSSDPLRMLRDGLIHPYARSHSRERRFPHPILAG